MIKVFIIAHIAPELQQRWLQHLRDFDTANPGCHFEVMADAPDVSMRDIVERMKLTFEQVFTRGTGNVKAAD